MKKIILIIILTTMVTGCSSITKDVKNTPQKNTNNTQSKDELQTSTEQEKLKSENTSKLMITAINN